MQKQPIVGEGHCGLTVTLNIADQYEITHLVEVLAYYEHQRNELQAWQEKRNAMKWEECKEWEKGNPRPKDPGFPYAELQRAFVFLSKLALTEASKATVFDPEEETEKGE